MRATEKIHHKGVFYIAELVKAEVGDVRDITQWEQTEHTQTDREIDSQVHLVGQSIYC